MSNSDANQRCMICRAIGFVLAAIIVGLITWWLFSKVAAWLAILAFLGLFALGLWLVLKYCGDPVGYDAGHGSAHGSSHGASMAAGAAGVAAAGAAVAGSASASGSDAADAAAQARAEADAKAAKMKADADAAAAKAKADADAAAAKARADAEAATAKAKADAEAAARAKADADAAARAKADAATNAKADADAAAKAKAAEVESARVKAELDAAKAKAEAERAAAAKAKSAASKAAAPASREKSVADGMAKGVSASGSVGTKPKGLTAARSGGADDLKRIKGVGPKMENMLNGMGYYHFDQVGDWGDQEVAWVDDNLEGFKGRVTRDRWVPQARLLAGGASVSDDVLERISAGEDVDLTDFDGDGVSEGASEGTRPAALSGPRGGKADNLKEIKGVGPKMEKMLHGMGFYHFDQVAAWTSNEVAWVDANLEGFKGRVSRDEWVKQAKVLASGGETEFSKRVDGGDVY